MRIARVSAIVILSAVVLETAMPALATPVELATAQPLDTLDQCFRAQWAETGKVTAINTAAGELLSLAFDSVGADGKVATGHLTFSIEDQGTQRKVTATAPNAADGALANQLLAQSVKKCLPDASEQRADAPPPSLLVKTPEH